MQLNVTLNIIIVLIIVKGFKTIKKGGDFLDDIKIVELYLKRDEEAIKLTSDKYGARLKKLAYRIVNDIQTAQECENDTYLQAWKSIPPNEPRDYFYPFLARITRHISFNCCREKNALKRNAHICELSREMEECLPDSEDVENTINEMLLKETINGFLSTLKEEKRNIFLRRYWFMDSIEEISNRYEISKSKVKIILFRIRKHLRKYLEKEDYMI